MISFNFKLRNASNNHGIIFYETCGLCFSTCLVTMLSSAFVLRSWMLRCVDSYSFKRLIRPLRKLSTKLFANCNAVLETTWNDESFSAGREVLFFSTSLWFRKRKKKSGTSLLSAQYHGESEWRSRGYGCEKHLLVYVAEVNSGCVPISPKDGYVAVFADSPPC